MEIAQVSIVLGATFLASIVSSVAGFGSGMAIIILFSFFMEIKLAVALSGLYFLINNTNKVIVYRKTIDWELLKYLLLGASPAIILGLYAFYTFSGNFISILLGLMGIYVVAEHFLHFLPRLKNFTPPRMIFFGFLWGLLTGTINGMPLKVMILKWRGLKKHLFVGTSSLMSNSVDLVKVIAYTLMGLLTFQDFLLWAPLFFMVSLLGTFIGKKILDRISIPVFEWIMLLIIFAGSIKLVFFG